MFKNTIFKFLITALIGILFISTGCAKKSSEKKTGGSAKKEMAGSGMKADKTPVKIGALFSITGASFLGIPEENTVKMLAEELNAKGGINGHPVELIIKDTKTNAAMAKTLAKQLIEEDKVIAIIGPSTSGETMAIKDLCEENKTILMSCAAAEVIVNPVAKYVFKTPQKDSYAAKWIFKTMQKMGITKIGVVVGNTGFGKAGKGQLAKYAKDYGIEILISEVYDKKATDLTDVLTKVKGKNVQAVVNWSITAAQSIVAINMKQLGMDIPLFQSHGFGNKKYIKNAGKAAEGIICPCGRLLVADALPDSNPQKSMLIKYKNDYESRYKEDVSTFGGHAYDAFMILVEAMKKAGVEDKDKIRDAIENTKNFNGTGGVFNFSKEDHNGLSMDAFEMLIVKDGKFTLYKQ